MENDSPIIIEGTADEVKKKIDEMGGLRADGDYLIRTFAGFAWPNSGTVHRIRNGETVAFGMVN